MNNIGFCRNMEASARMIFDRDAYLVILVDCQIPSDDLIVHFLGFLEADGFALLVEQKQAGIQFP